MIDYDSKDDVGRALDALCDLCDDELSPWEAKFVDSLARQWQEGKTFLTTPQRDKLAEIVGRVL